MNSASAPAPKLSWVTENTEENTEATEQTACLTLGALRVRLRELRDPIRPSSWSQRIALGFQLSTFNFHLFPLGV